jgi:very-short-patch-repair endonuclease
VDVTVNHPSRSSQRIRRHVSQVPADERTHREGIPVTIVPRTVLDLSATEPVDVIEAALREAEYRELRHGLSLPDLLERYPGRRGVRRAQEVLERLEVLPRGRTRSRLEERFVPFLRRHRLPRPHFNDWIAIGGRRFQVDCHWRGTGQVLELDGWQGHGTRSAFRDDRARDRVLRVGGYAVTRLTWSQLDDEPAAIAADIRALLEGRRRDQDGRLAPALGTAVVSKYICL